MWNNEPYCLLHNFTQTGTFKAARAMLDHVRSTGADVEGPGILMAEHGKLAADVTCSLGPWGYVVIELSL